MTQMSQYGLDTCSRLYNFACHEAVVQYRLSEAQKQAVAGNRFLES